MSKNVRTIGERICRIQSALRMLDSIQNGTNVHAIANLKTALNCCEYLLKNDAQNDISEYEEKTMKQVIDFLVSDSKKRA